jgi:hypothetical protein
VSAPPTDTAPTTGPTPIVGPGPAEPALAPTCEVTVRPERVLATLVATALVLTLVSFTADTWAPVLDPRDLLQLRRLLNVNAEQNIPTWYQGLTLLASAGLLALIGLAARQRGGRDTFHWLGLAAVFTGLSIDEFASIHETVGDALGNKLVGATLYAWVVPGALFAAAIFLLYLRFLLRLPRRTAVLFVLSGALFLGGAVVTEFIEGRIQLVDGRKAIFPLRHVEELGEMLGVALFIYTLLSYACGRVRSVRFRLLRTARDG